MPLPRLDIFEKMRGIYTPVTDIRRKVLAEVARMIAQEKPPEYIETIPYKIITKDTPTYRDCVFRERAIVRERVRLAFGMDLKAFGAHGPIDDKNIVNAMKPEKVIQKPIVNVIKIGCERCPTESYIVSDVCKACIAHPCTSVCPVNAVSMKEDTSHIDQEKCIRCGRCAQVCPYNAIAYRERPCAAACGVDAIESDEQGFAQINYDKCVTCGLCIVSCPFAAIAEKSEIVQIMYALKEGNTHAIIAPSFVSQFGPLVKPEMIYEAIHQIGFKSICEVAYGADKSILSESEELLHLMAKKDEVDIEDIDLEEKDTQREFVGTSCCPSWVLAAKKNFPEMSHNISESYTPMVETAKRIKKKHPDGNVVMIGPCIAKKMECFHPEVQKFVDFIMTFEELAALFVGLGVDPTEIEPDTESKTDDMPSKLGRGFPVAGGVRQAIQENLKNMAEDEIEIPTESADTLEDCMDLLKKFKRGRLNPKPYLVEGMACPNGCIGGPGTLAPINRAKREVKKYKDKALKKFPKKEE